MRQERIVAEGLGFEPRKPYRVYGLAIRCITTLPSLRRCERAWTMKTYVPVVKHANRAYKRGK